MALNIKVGFIGFGRMGSALARGALSSKVLRSSQLIAFDVDLKARQNMGKLKIKSAKDPGQVIQFSDLVFLCVKPQQVMDVVQTLPSFRPGLMDSNKCFASVAAGVRIAQLEEGLGSGVPVLRIMPNTPAVLRAGMSVICLGQWATASHQKLAAAILKSVGDVETVPELLLDAVTAVSGSGPAYAFYLAEAMIEAGVELGLTADLARKIVHQTVYGAGRMLKEDGRSAQELRLQVTSPGGTTAEAVDEFENKGLKTIISTAMERAAERSRQLSAAGLKE